MKEISCHNCLLHIPRSFYTDLIKETPKKFFEFAGNRIIDGVSVIIEMR